MKLPQSPNFRTFKEPRNRFQEIDSPSLCNLAGRYVKYCCHTGPPGWESISGLLKRFTNSGSGLTLALLYCSNRGRGGPGSWISVELVQGPKTRKCTVPCTATPRNLPLNAKNLADHGPSLPGVKCASRGGGRGGGGVGYFRGGCLVVLFHILLDFVKWFLVRNAYLAYNCDVNIWLLTNM
jgi:hypothetical protein